MLDGHEIDEMSIDFHKFPSWSGYSSLDQAASLSSDQAAAAEKVDKSSMEAVLREQMQRHKKDLQSMLEVPFFGNTRITEGYRKGIEGFCV